MKDITKKITEDFYNNNQDLLIIKQDINKFCEVLLACFKNKNKLLVCGNGGSSADADHIVGELMKGFMLKRPLLLEDKQKLINFGQDGEFLANNLQSTLEAISLGNHNSLNSAFSNDVDPKLIYAQQVLGYCKTGDLVLGISTSGNAENVKYALICAKACGATTLLLTGCDGGKAKEFADYSIISPRNQTFRIQEHHLAIYHYFCAFVEFEMFKI